MVRDDGVVRDDGRERVIGDSHFPERWLKTRSIGASLKKDHRIRLSGQEMTQRHYLPKPAGDCFGENMRSEGQLRDSVGGAVSDRDDPSLASPNGKA